MLTKSAPTPNGLQSSSPSASCRSRQTSRAYQHRKERKERKVKLLSAKKKHYTLSQELVGHWETIRQHNVGKEKRSALVTTVLEKSTGRIAELAASHVTSRVLQACAKYGTGAQRAAMLAEVLPEFVPLAKSPYGHFMLRKLVATAPKATVPGVCYHGCPSVDDVDCVIFPSARALRTPIP